MTIRDRAARMKVVVGVAFAGLFVTACGAAVSGDDAGDAGALSNTTGSSEVTTSVPDPSAPATSAFPVGPSALDDMRDDRFPDPLVDLTQIISGGPPPDGIPPIDVPRFLPISENLEFLPANEPVVALEINGDARAYPIRALVWHEIVNDVVGGIPVTVTYCPLCNSAATYDRRINGAETTFGTSGLLFASALVMYDRATESLWTHFDGEAVVGVLTGARLEEYPSPLLSWGDFRSAYPTGQVLDFEASGFDRDYGRNPYRGYDAEDNTPFLFRGALDDRALAMQRVVGIESGDASSAFSLSAVSGGEGRATMAEVGSTRVAIFWVPGQSSALDTSAITEGRDVGSVGVFAPELDGRTLTFVFEDGGFVDEETGSTWTITGEAIDGELSGSRLERLPHLDTFWFAWSTYQPGTELIGS